MIRIIIILSFIHKYFKWIITFEIDFCLAQSSANKTFDKFINDRAAIGNQKLCLWYFTVYMPKDLNIFQFEVALSV